MKKNEELHFSGWWVNADRLHRYGHERLIPNLRAYVGKAVMRKRASHILFLTGLQAEGTDLSKVDGIKITPLDKTAFVASFPGESMVKGQGHLIFPALG